MASQPLPTKTPNRITRPARRSTLESAPRRNRSEADSEPSRLESGTAPGVDNHSSLLAASSPSPAPGPGASARNSTLVFRALLLVAAAGALAFTLAALLAAPGRQSTNPTSPGAPPPAALVQPDG